MNLIDNQFVLKRPMLFASQFSWDLGTPNSRSLRSTSFVDFGTIFAALTVDKTDPLG